MSKLSLLSRRTFLKKSFRWSLAAGVAAAGGRWLDTMKASDEEVRFIPVEPVHAANSINAAIFRNALVSWKDHQFAAYWDDDGFLKVARRRREDSEWDIRNLSHHGNVRDAHNVVSIGVSPEGRLHLSYDHHNQRLRYRMEDEPGSFEFREPQAMTTKRESSVTYPCFVNTPDDQFYFFYRDGASGDGDLLINRFDTERQRWQVLQHPLITGGGEYNPYFWRPGVGPDGSLHLAWCWRRTYEAETNQNVCYAVSRDGGHSWEHSDGTKYELPITFEQAEVIDPAPEGSNLINQCSSYVDEKNRPHVTHYRNDNQGIPQFYHFHLNDEGKWIERQVSERKESFDLGGGGTLRIPISRPDVVVDRDGRAILIYRDETDGGRVRLSWSDAPDYVTWHHRDITDFEVGMWEPGYDPIAMRERNSLELWVNRCEQGMNERSVPLEPQMAKVAVIDPARLEEK